MTIEVKPGKTYNVTFRAKATIDGLALAGAVVSPVYALSVVEVAEEPPVGSIVRDKEGDLLAHIHDGEQGWAYVLIDGGVQAPPDPVWSWGEVSDTDPAIDSYLFPAEVVYIPKGDS